MSLLEKVEQGLEQLKENKQKELPVTLSYFDLLEIRKGLKQDHNLRLLLKETVKEQNVYRKLMRESDEVSEDGLELPRN